MRSRKAENKHTEEGHPFERVQQCPEECLLTDSVAIPREGQGTGNQEHKERAAQHIPRRKIAVIERIGDPAGQEVVYNGQWQRRANGVVSADVTKNSELGRDLHV